MEELLKPYIEKALQLAEKTGEFVIEQAPELLQQFYAWHTVKNIAGITGSVLLIIIAVWGCILERTSHNYDRLGFIMAIIGFMIGIPMIIISSYGYLCLLACAFKHFVCQCLWRS